MQSARGRWAWTAAVALGLVTIGAAVGQDQNPAPKAAPRAKAPRRPRPGGLRAPVAPPKALRRGAGDPLAKPDAAKAQEKADPGTAAAVPAGLLDWPFHYKIKLAGADGTPLAASYYPSRAGDSAAVVMLVHERGPGHGGKDFEQPVLELANQSLAAHLQEQDYAVLALDLRGHGANPRREQPIGNQEWAAMVGDLQAAYRFLVGRHNRRELNLNKLGVIALGDGANLASYWAASPGGAVSSEGRISDLGALVLVAPAQDDDSGGLRLGPALNVLAPRLPILLVSNERMAPLADALKPVLERHRRSKVLSFPTRLQGDRLLRFEPKVAEAVVKFLEEPVKFRDNADWEGRYLFNPTPFTVVETVSGADAAAADAPREPADAKAKAEVPAAKEADPPAPRAKARPRRDANPRPKRDNP